jgi:hypothetical protein
MRAGALDLTAHIATPSQNKRLPGISQRAGSPTWPGNLLVVGNAPLADTTNRECHRHCLPASKVALDEMEMRTVEHWFSSHRTGLGNVDPT